MRVLFFCGRLLLGTACVTQQSPSYSHASDETEGEPRGLKKVGGYGLGLIQGILADLCRSGCSFSP